ncbi:MAG: hypothetical protein KG075_01605 [Alphaproteobacteria bacterium]|nr:hypothetical protein [Alphaproteobacteria bacterium]
MTPNACFELLDATDPDAVAAYERSFYDAFAGLTTNRLIRWLWLWDEDKRRLATRIPYADQLIYLQRTADGRIAAALAVNVALRQLQAGAFGFRLPPGDGLCEFLTVFVNADHDLKSRHAFWSDTFADLRRRGLHSAYATTARRPLLLYRRLGGIVADSATIETEERFLLHFTLTRDYIRRRDSAAAAAAAE